MAAYTEKGTAQQPNITQPQAVPTMTIKSVGNRNVKGIPMDDDGTRAWSNGICSCCNEPGTCFLAWWCPCITYAKNKRRYEYLNSNEAPDPEKGGDWSSSDCWLHCLLTGCFNAGWVLQFVQRGHVRSRYNIKGGQFGDCCTSCCCSPCALTQEYQELELEEKSFGSQGPVPG